MRTLFLALAVGLLVLVAAPQNALACHKGTPHGNETSCGGGGSPTSRTVFITSATYNGALGGVIGGDTRCQALADAAELSGTFLAWLSDSTTSPAADPDFVKSAVPYVRVDGVMVASNWADLVDGSLLALIEVDEQGNHPGPLGPISPARSTRATEPSR